MISWNEPAFNNKCLWHWDQCEHDIWCKCYSSYSRQNHHKWKPKPKQVVTWVLQKSVLFQVSKRQLHVWQPWSCLSEVLNTHTVSLFHLSVMSVSLPDNRHCDLPCLYHRLHWPSRSPSSIHPHELGASSLWLLLFHSCNQDGTVLLYCPL